MQISDELLIRALNGEADEEDHRRLLALLKGDPELRAEHARLRHVWAMEEWTMHRVRMDAPPPVEEVIRRVDARCVRVGLAGREAAPQPRRGSWGLTGALTLATAALLAAVIFRGEAPTPFGAEEFRTGPGELATVSFRDGTVIRLAPETSVRLVGTHGRREVELEGQAYFAVSASESNPLVVHTAAGVARVLGTRFNVRVADDSLNVAVVEGEVLVSGAAGEARVRASQIGVLDQRGPPAVRTVPDVFDELAWLGAFVGLESTNLESVIAEMNRRFGLRIQVEDRILFDRSVSGWFADQPAEEMLARICRAIDAICVVQDGIVVMKAVSR